MPDVLILAKNHRGRNESRSCEACGAYRHRTARFKIVVNHTIVYTVDICSGCLAEAHRTAVEGKKVRE